MATGLYPKQFNAPQRNSEDMGSNTEAKSGLKQTTGVCPQWF